MWCLTSAQRAYCEAVALLLDAPDHADDEMLRQVLVQLNALAASADRIEGQLQDVDTGLGGSSVDSLQAERVRIEAKVAASADPVTRSALSQSLRVYEQRIETALALSAAHGRLDAQYEVIVQTISSAVSAVTRLLVAEASAAPEELEEAQHRLREIGTQAQAIENAVGEVVAQRLA